MITNDLKSAAQVAEACKKANRALGMISRTIKYKSCPTADQSNIGHTNGPDYSTVLLSIFYTLVRPHLEHLRGLHIMQKIRTC